jgi:putative membrane protein
LKTFNKYQIATAIAIIFHIVGLIGILFSNSEDFIKTTPLNLLLMAGLLFYTQDRKGASFYVFFAACFLVGMGAEITGTATGWLFGEYAYGEVLGPGILSVPFIIGINWFIILYCCGVSIQMLLRRLTAKLSEQTGLPAKSIQTLSVVIDGATLAVLLDWLIEPVAVKLGYWKWLGTGDIPLYNYICWFAVSMVLLLLFRRLDFNKHNKFAVNLLLIQAMFFLLLRTFL